MSVFRFPCSHNASITDTASFGYLNPSSKASGIAVALFQRNAYAWNSCDDKKAGSDREQ